MGTRKTAKTGAARTGKKKRSVGAGAKKSSSSKKKKTRAKPPVSATAKKRVVGKKKRAAGTRRTTAATTSTKKTANSAKSTAGTAVRKTAKKAAKAKKTVAKKKVTTGASRRTSNVATPSEIRAETLSAAPIPKTRLLAKQLREFKTLLLTKRAQLAGDFQHLTDEALSRDRSRTGSSSSMPIHMAELGSDNWEREFTLGLAANERALMREIDEALERIRTKTYGVCSIAHEPISIARLRAKPWANHCIACARKRDEGRHH